MQLEVKLHKLIRLAYAKGYRVTDDGRLLGMRGERKITIPPSGQYPRFTINCGTEYSKDGTYGIPTHMFAAYCYYGEEMFKEYLQVRHLNGDIADVSRSNIRLGTKQENEDDKSKETRRKVGAINAIKRKGITPANAKFTKNQVLDIRNKIENGETNSEIARYYNVHRNNIRDIKVGNSYRNIKK